MNCEEAYIYDYLRTEQDFQCDVFYEHPKMCTVDTLCYKTQPITNHCVARWKNVERKRKRPAAGRKPKKKVTTTTSTNHLHLSPIMEKNDIRNQYARMIANVLNSCSFPLIRRFFQCYGVARVRLLFRHDPLGSFDPAYRRNWQYNGRFTGADLIACMLGAFPNSAPDYTMELQDDVEIRSQNTHNSDGSSTLTFKYIARATYLYEYSIRNMVKYVVDSFVTTQQEEAQQLQYQQASKQYATPPETIHYGSACDNHLNQRKRKLVEQDISELSDREDEEKEAKDMSWRASLWHLMESQQQLEDEEEREEDLNNAHPIITGGEEPLQAFVEKLQQLQLKQLQRIGRKVPFRYTINGSCVLQLTPSHRIRSVTFTRSTCRITVLHPSLL